MATITVDFNDLPYKRDFAIRPGDAIEWPITLQVNTATSTLVGCTISYTVTLVDGTSVIASTTITADTPASGTFTFRLTAAQTAAWDGDYRYKVKIVWPSAHANFSVGATRVVMEGTITASA